MVPQVLLRSPAPVTLLPLPGLGIIAKGDDVGARICDASRAAKFDLRRGDILVVAQTIVSRAEGRLVDLTSVKPSARARKLAKTMDKEPEHVEAILRASKRIVRAEQGHLITETPHGFVCANSGVDRSNVPGGHYVSLLPENPDVSARRIRETIRRRLGSEVAVIVSDSFGRPFRNGAVNVALGVSGLAPIKSYIGMTDLFGYQLRVKQMAVADELASAAELLMGEASEGVAVVIIRGYAYDASEDSAQLLVRDPKLDIFRR
jgi:coenzyme F420-0:L-glutamate ligase/coenzyme F420-1:gamma-L-glutamate ligase